jgi:hypothetical protein
MAHPPNVTAQRTRCLHPEQLDALRNRDAETPNRIVMRKAAQFKLFVV